MKKAAYFLLFGLFVASLQPVFAQGEYGTGIIYEDTVVPVVTGPALTSKKEGSAVCKNVLGIVQWGQCGITDAANNGKIKAIHHVDVYREGCFIFKKMETRVYGEQ